jgi:gustatory receptor
VILACDSVVKEAGAVVTLGYDLRCCLKTAQFLDDLKLKKFTNFLEKNLPKFTAANFFNVGRWTILDLFETLITFLIIMIQFGNSARKQQ